MLSLQPIHLFRYLGFKSAKLDPSIKQLFYLSWEDALWDILKKKNVIKGSYILVPEFFCGDVENNIRSHGYKIAHYPVAKNLTSDFRTFVKKLQEYEPKVVVIFHAVGIKSNLLKDRKWLNQLDKNSILIEDCVHRIVNLEKLVLYRENHIIMDSLRKVIPIQGCCVYGSIKYLNFSEPSITQSWFYSLKVHLFWFLMVTCWNLCQVFANKKLSAKFAIISEKLMINGYNIIGDAKLPAKGLFIFGFLQKYINYDKIYEIKRRQVELYEEELQHLLPIKVPYNELGKKELRGWPIVMDTKYASNVLNYLRANGLIIRFELNDSIWSKRQKIIYLPLGLHINKQQQLEVTKLVANSLKQIKP
jgi:hypothetical protein